MKGRPPKPTHLKVLHGEKNKERINRDEPKPPSGMPRCPSYLDKTARAKWRETVKLLADMGIVSKAETMLLELYCVAYSNYRKCQASVDKVGPVLVSTRDGRTEVKRNPFSVELHKYSDTLHRLAAELGLSYVSRTRIKTDIRQAQQGVNARVRA